MSARHHLGAPTAAVLAIALCAIAPAVSIAQAPGAKGAASSAATASTAPGVVTPRPVALPAKPRPRPKPAAYQTVGDANASARSYPTPSAYVNSALYYDYEPGRLYTVQTSPRFLTAITLRPGEKLISKAAGDTVRWVLGETVQGAGSSEQVIVMLKPIRGGLRTNVILTTDQRSYLLDATSIEGDAYTSVIGWNYPQEALREAQASAAAEASKAAPVVASGLSVEQLNFDYAVKPVHTRAPRWMPLRVFDDGLKTYIQFPVNMAATDAPPLFLVGDDKAAELVNYRYLNGYYVVDRLIDVAELRLGEKRQTVVRITRARAWRP
ncbi:MAG: P-type conjugative transfer protein TrbG [Pseudomonadota bacterium]